MTEPGKAAVPGGDQDWESLVPLDALTAWMDARGLGRGPIENPQLLAGGTQNILLRFERAGRAYVLRRPPKHLRANSNETMRREARVLAALAGTDVRHPGLIAACRDEDVIGAAFYLMEPVEGFTPARRDAGAARRRSGDPPRMGLEMVDAIAALAKVDYAARGLPVSAGSTASSSARWAAGAHSWRATPSIRAGRDSPACPASTRSAAGSTTIGRPTSGPA